MQKTVKIYLFIFGAALLLMVVNDFTAKKPIDWSYSFVSSHKIPYGTYVIHDRLKHYFDGNSIENIRKSPYEILLDKHKSGNKNYIFINNRISFDEKSANSLMDFVFSGNTVFMSGWSFPQTIKDSLGVETSIMTSLSNTVSVRLVNEHLDNTIFNLEKGSQPYYFSKLNPDNSTILGLMFSGDQKKEPNFVKIDLGKGAFYLHTQPFAYTNFNLLESNNIRYAASSLSYLPKQDIFWDEKSKAKSDEIGTPLRFILSKPALKWAWFTALISLIVFMFFRAKRRQRVISIQTKPKNSSIEFAKTIGTLYFQKGKPKDIIDKKIILFLDFVRRTYFLETANLNNKFISKLHLKSGVEKNEVQVLINMIINLNNTNNSTDGSLVKLDQLLENFYSKTRN